MASSSSSSSALAELLGELAGHAKQLEDTHQLDEFQRQASEVCGACELSLEQLAAARAELKATTPETWEALAESDVSVTDAVK